MSLVDVAVDDGAVTGAVVVVDGEASETVTAGSVILATNGFGANADLVRELIPEIADGLYFGGERSVGDALRIGEGLGADVGWLDAYQGHGSVAVPHGVLVTWAVVMHGGVVVDVAGRRFDDETCGYSVYAARVLAQPQSSAWMIFDQRIAALCEPFADYQDSVVARVIRWAETAEELAELTGCRPALVETISTTQACAAGLPDSFGRTDWEAPLAPPFAAVSITGALFHTQGGGCSSTGTHACFAATLRSRGCSRRVAPQSGSPGTGPAAIWLETDCSPHAGSDTSQERRRRGDD